MPLDETDMELVRRSLRRLRESAVRDGGFGPAFYNRLFERMPEAREMFREDLSEQGMRFLSTLTIIVDSMDAPEACNGTVAKLASGHRAYGVRADQYAPMGEALRETMRERLGERYDDETDAAWAAAYDRMAARMIEAGGAA